MINSNNLLKFTKSSHTVFSTHIREPGLDKVYSGKRTFLYELDLKTKTGFVYQFDLSGKLIYASVRSSHLSQEEANALMMKLDSEKKLANELANERERQYENQEQIRLKRESVLLPQAMYLQAGKYDRNGQQSDAVRLYELLIEKHPNHALAVQANNRLVSIRTLNEASQRTYNNEINNRNQASKECRERKMRYQYGCTAGTANCYEQAQSICSE